MGSIRMVRAGVAGLASGVLMLLFIGLVVIGGTVYRKDCLTSSGTVSKSWTFLAPFPFVFRPSETNCVVHVGTRVALNAIGIDTFKPSTPESIAGQLASRARVDPYWPKLIATIKQLQNEPPAASMSAGITTLTKARDALASLSPPAAYSAAHQRFVATFTAMIMADHRAQNAELRNDRQGFASAAAAYKADGRRLNSDIARLDQIHAAQ